MLAARLSHKLDRMYDVLKSVARVSSQDRGKIWVHNSRIRHLSTKAKVREMCSPLVKKPKNVSLSVKHWCSSNAKKTYMRVWWESRHPLPLTNTTEHSGNCWLTVPGHDHAAMQEPSFTNKTVSFAPANHNAYSHTRWQCYYHLKIIVFFLLVTPFLKSNWQHQPPWPLSLAPWCICTYWQQREIEGRGPHQKAPSVLIDMHQLSSYRLL